MHFGNGFTQGTRGGEQGHQLSVSQMPAHAHTAKASSSNADAPIPAGLILAASPNEVFHDPTNLQPMRAGTVLNAGSSQAHNNMQPFITLNFCIALTGQFPSQN